LAPYSAALGNSGFVVRARCKADLGDGELAHFALDDINTRRLMAIPGVDMAVAVAIVATVGDFSRFESPDKLVSYVGLNPSVRQSGGLPGTHGRISK
jgi:transposase